MILKEWCFNAAGGIYSYVLYYITMSQLSQEAQMTEMVQLRLFPCPEAMNHRHKNCYFIRKCLYIARNKY